LLHLIPNQLLPKYTADPPHNLAGVKDYKIQ